MSNNCNRSKLNRKRSLWFDDI